MKTRVIMTVVPSAVAGAIILLLGCGAEPKKAGANNNGPTVITVSAPSQTNEPAPPVEPVPKIAAAPAKLSPGLDEIVQLAQAGVGDDVLLAFVENSPTTYKLEVDEILYLHDLGVSKEVIAELVKHGQAPTEPAPALVGAAPEPSTPVETAVTNAPPPAAEAAPSDANAYAVTPPVEQVNYNYFYQTLSPYGSWIEVPAYGWCWRPTAAVVDVNWRPYSDRGRWLWTDCGWYWQSDYAWGWAPFHYGRWQRSPAYGWVWYPDTAWAPAWVTWRYSDAYCGWAPLPPGAQFDVSFGFSFHGGRVGVGFGFGLLPDCYTFIPTSRFCDRTPWHHRLQGTQVTTIYNRTTIINNYKGGSNHRTVVNLGPGENAIAAVSRTEIRKVTLRDANPNGGTLIKTDRLDHDGKTLAVFRPQLPKQASAPPPEITRRQQELRIKTDSLVNSDVVRLARADAERKTTFAPANRGSARTRSPELRAPLIASKLSDSPTGILAPSTGEARRNIKDGGLNTPTTQATVPPPVSRSPRSELRNPAASSPTLVAPSQQTREARPAVGAAPNTFESLRRESDGRSVAIQTQQRPQPEFRPQPGERPEAVDEEKPVFRQQPRSAEPQSFRQESRRVESGARTFIAPPVNGRSAGQSITPPNVIQPRESDRRFSSPEYRPPQNNYSPPVVAPRAIQAPALRPSSPAPSPAPPPAVSQPQPAPSSPAPASRPSSPPSQSRGESRKR